MEETIHQEEQSQQSDINHPWLEVPECSLDEDLRFTLDEIRIS